MDYRQDFIQGVVGPLGAEALIKAMERVPTLAPALAPRVLVAWLSTQEGGFAGQIPGVASSYLSLSKSEGDSYSGLVTVGDDTYTFEDEPFLRVAAGLSVALGVDNEMDPRFRPEDISNLGKSIDRLVLSKAGVELPGKPAPQRQDKPEGFLAPTKGNKGARPGEFNPNVSRTGSAPSIVAKGEIPVTKKELEASCPTCKAKEFEGEKFVGCKCVKDLEKSDSSFVRDGKGGWKLTFGQSWSHNSISVVCNAIKR